VYKIILEEIGSLHDAFREGLDRVSARCGKERPVLIPSCDEAVEVLVHDRAQLESRFRILLPDDATIEILMDKWVFDRAVREKGLLAPRTWLLADPGPPDDHPRVLKPRRRYSRSGALLEPARMVARHRDLAELSSELKGDPDEYIVQELIPGGDDRVEFYGAFWKAGSPVAEFTGAKIRQFPPRSGSTACARLTDDREVLELSRRLLKSLKYEGCVDVEFKRGLDGARYVIEVNARPGLWHTLGELAGVSLPLVAAEVAYGDTPRVTARPRVGKRWIYLERDLRTILERRRSGEGSISEFLLGLPRVRRFAVLSLTDPAPFFRRFARLVLRRLRRRSDGGIPGASKRGEPQGSADSR
jgi:predicted ATP-grasp superfamily ATP-dependent carboligase